ncbi:ABC transporter ATP-binding protein [Lysinibacillus xylanilyticus]|uniref:ABC transporter ATP-binding protein n=1 Tax=Lysinibacillus xylanilyticus TaxID=582475 RepID=UPI003D07654C
MKDSDLALQLIGLSKQFEDHTAVNSVNLSVPCGSFFGLVGPNGAGKTTLLSMAIGLLRPDHGASKIFGVNVWSNPLQAKTLVGVLPDGMSLPERLTGRELLTYMGLLRGLDTKTVAQRTEDLLDILDFSDDERTLVINYSTGMRKKIGLATALLHSPKLLVLDEPFEAVDPISASTIRTLLQSFVTTGGSVILSSHVMPLVEQLCDHVAVIAKGSVAATGPLDLVCNGKSLEESFISLVGHRPEEGKKLSWLM